MGMIHANVSIESELHKLAKEQGINMSEILRRALKEQLQAKETIPIDVVIADLEGWMKQAQDAKERLLKKREELMNAESERQASLKAMYDPIPEIQNLASAQLTDMQFLLSLVDVVRQKYGLVKAGVNSLLDYYKLKNAEDEAIHSANPYIAGVVFHIPASSSAPSKVP